MQDVELLHRELDHGHRHLVALVVAVHANDGRHDEQIPGQGMERRT